MDYKVEYLKKRRDIRQYSKFVLGGDVGGTNTSFGVAGIKKSKLELLFTLHFKTQKIGSLVSAVNETLKYCKDIHRILIKNACFGVAGIVSSKHDICKMVNVNLDIDVKEILKKTKLKSAYLVNDFELIGYGINLLDINDKKDVSKTRHRKYIGSHMVGTTKAIVGAGTGLGKSILVCDDDKKSYTPVASEGGHGDFPAQDQSDINLVEFIKKTRKVKQVSYEEVIAGRGIGHIYMFLRSLKKFKHTPYTKKICDNGYDVESIARYKNKDKTCKETFRLYAKYYARCVKNFALDSLSIGGIYIAGGIAAKHKEMFNTKEFINEFENNDRLTDILKKMPIYVIVNPNVSLYGACLAALKNR
ncbi:MAG: glucokinase [Nanoarchaeota archaeon]